MIEKKIIADKKNEYTVKEYVKKVLGMGKVSDIKIERTPVGERIIVFTTRPGIVIGAGGETIQRLTDILKKQFKLENPKIEVAEITEPEFDAKTVADQLALAFERFGPRSFKMRAYAALEKIKNAGGLGAEIVLAGKLPAEKAKTWRFSYGYMKKTGEIKIVNKAESTANTRPGVIGIKVAIVPKDAVISDKIKTDLDEGITEEVVVENKEEEKKEHEKNKEEEKAEGSGKINKKWRKKKEKNGNIKEERNESDA